MTANNDIDTTQFNDSPREARTTSSRGRKRKYNTDEERLEARRIQQRAYRERKKAELAALKASQEA